MNQNSFQINHVSVSYGSRPVLKDVSFSAVPGTLTGLLGCNGCGKTTLLKAICNQLPHTGQCLCNGLVLEQLPGKSLAKQISYIPQRTGITISMTVLDVVLMGYNASLNLLEHYSAQMKQSALNALQTVGLKDFASQDYLTLSEGEKQLCILARTLVEQTQLLLLDEPDSSLDFHNKYCMISLLVQLVQKYSKTAILCLHDPQLALDFCDRLVLLKDGTVSAVLSPGTDSTDKMELAFSQIYGSVSLKSVEDSRGQKRFLLLSEQ